MKIVYILLIILFTACGSGSSGKKSTTTNLTEKLISVQWSMYWNNNFYVDNDIDENAHIHHKENIEQYTGAGITIVVIDDGLDVTHEDLIGAISDTWDLSTGSSNVEQNTVYDYHGTAVTGIIAARDNDLGLRGLACNSNIIFLKHKQNMSDSETIELLSKAESYNPDIISNSWGTYNVSDSVKYKIQEMANNGRNGKGVIFVWAVGNNQRNIEGDESAIPEVIAVGSTNKYNARAYYSNYGVELDVMAPGGNDNLGVATLDVMGSLGIGYNELNYILPTDTNTFNGTSASAPIVSAIVAILLEIDTNLTRVDVENIIRNSSDKIGDVEYINGHNLYYGYGKVNLTKAIDLATF
ncbi:MAG: S8 family serine peptidase [Sulfurimonas sp.]|nr:S8 family serine peptidase [Sulfurimonas sp.]